MAADARTTVLRSRLFDEWAYHLAGAVGHHSSDPLTPEIPFSATMKVVRSGEVAVVDLEGSSSIRLHRHQPEDRVVIWLPRQGWVQETVNGEPVCAEPGTAMVCLPGDELLGETTRSLSGISIVLPSSFLGDRLPWRHFSIRHVSEGSEAMALVACAHELAATLIHGHCGEQQLLYALADQLSFWRHCQDPERSRDSCVPVERRAVIARAREWMDAHLGDSFRIADLAADLHLSLRTLQSCFRAELGRSPLEELRRLRFHRLRQRIGGIPPEQGALELLFRDCGLTFSVTTLRHYRNWCGETPSQTMARVQSP